MSQQQWEHSVRTFGASRSVGDMLNIAQCYLRWLESRGPTTRDQRLSAFNIVRLTSIHAPERVIQIADLGPLSRADVAEIAAITRPAVEKVLFTIATVPDIQHTVYVADIERPEIRELVRTAEVGWAYDTFLEIPLPLFGASIWAAAQENRHPHPLKRAAICFRCDSRTCAFEYLRDELMAIRGPAWLQECGESLLRFEQIMASKSRGK